MEYNMEKRSAELLLRRRFFICSSAQIYGGVSGLYDYGPLGCLLKNAIADIWREMFIQEESLFELDTAILLPYEVLKASGHVEKFSDMLVFDKCTGEFYRADHAIRKRLEELPWTEEIGRVLNGLEGLSLGDAEELIERFGVKSDQGNDLVGAAEFNLIFKTSVGPKSQNASFLRPETAQGQFLNFKRLYDLNNERLPFGSATIGRVFRNEISPRSGLLRVREFDQAEIEYFVDPLDKAHPRFSRVSSIEVNFKFELSDKHARAPEIRGALQKAGDSYFTMSLGNAVSMGIVNSEVLGYFIGRTHVFLTRIGIRREHLRFRQHVGDEMAHYACDCWDAEVMTSYGWVECVGIADRSSYDLEMHQRYSKSSLKARRVLNPPVEVSGWEAVIDKKALGRELKSEFPKFVQEVEDALSGRAGDGLLSGVQDKSPGCSPRTLDFGFQGKTYKLEVHQVRKKVASEEFIPHVVEPSFGMGRIFYSVCEHGYWKRDKERSVLSLSPLIAPVQCEVSFLVKDAKLIKAAENISSKLSGTRVLLNTRNVTIGKKYSVADEIGVPYYVTVDFETLNDGQVTVRERDTMEQIRVEVTRVASIVSDFVNCRREWGDTKIKHAHPF